MSWSMSAEGSPEQCIAVCRERQQATQANLPEFEQPQVEQVIDAAESLLQNAVDPEAKVTLNVSGSGYRGDGKAYGSLGIGVSYTLPEQPAARQAENEG